jgi:hypothetical protein
MFHINGREIRLSLFEITMYLLKGSDELSGGNRPSIVKTVYAKNARTHIRSVDVWPPTGDWGGLAAISIAICQYGHKSYPTYVSRHKRLPNVFWMVEEDPKTLVEFPRAILFRSPLDFSEFVCSPRGGITWWMREISQFWPKTKDGSLGAPSVWGCCP